MELASPQFDHVRDKRCSTREDAVKKTHWRCSDLWLTGLMGHVCVGETYSVVYNYVSSETLTGAASEEETDQDVNNSSFINHLGQCSVGEYIF